VGAVGRALNASAENSGKRRTSHALSPEGGTEGGTDRRLRLEEERIDKTPLGSASPTTMAGEDTRLDTW
jgi:hypothetical protein